MRITQIALVVRDYDEARDWFVEKLGFTCFEDKSVANEKRWVRVGPSPDFTLLLARAATPDQSRRVGNQTGGRVFLFLETDDFSRDHDSFRDQGVRFIEEPRDENYGRVAVFEDLYGNRWDLIERRG